MHYYFYSCLRLFCKRQMEFSSKTKTHSTEGSGSGKHRPR